MLTTVGWQVLDGLHRNPVLTPALRQGLLGLLRRGLLDRVPAKWGRQTLRELVLCRIEAASSTGVRFQELVPFFPSLS